MASPNNSTQSQPADHRRQDRKGTAKRYPTDLTDAQWAVIEPLLPPPAKRGRRDKHTRREIVNAILYVDRAGCSWRMLPKDFPPWGTVYWHFKQWKNDGTTARVNDALRDQLRDAYGRDPMASAGVIDSQSLRGADTVGAGQRGYDAGNHAGWVVMPGSAVGSVVLGGDRLGLVGITTGLRGR